MKLKAKLISSAVVAAFGAVAGTAHAVNLGQDGQGQVLIYPYYSAQTKGSTAMDTYVTIVNSDAVFGKAVKVRFIEGKASREVLDFNLYLSPNDMWTAAITRDANGNPILRTTDTSCTAPEIPLNAGTGVREAGFVNYAYAGDNVKDDSLARALEGYVEVIQMADLQETVVTAVGKFDTFKAAKHAAGVPANCAGIRAAWLAGDYGTATDGMVAPTGTLSGYGTLINPAEGTDITFDAVAIDAFSDVANHQAPGSIQPDLSAVQPKISTVLVGSNTYNTDWNFGIAVGNLTDAVPVSAVIMRDQVINEYAVAAAPVGLGTDWVVTFPTKRLHTLAANTDPFDNTKVLGTTGWCETVSLSAYDREEGYQTSGLIFSPPPPAGVNTLCWEANVVSITNSGVSSNVLGSVNVRQTLGLPFSAGWLRMSFIAASQEIPAAIVGPHTIVTPLGGAPAAPAAYAYEGLPVVGFMTQSFVNTGTVANYGGTSTHRYNHNIHP